MITANPAVDTSRFISFAKGQMGDFQTPGTLAYEFKRQTDQTGPRQYPNFWQIGCVFDTILDYFLALKEAGELADTDRSLMRQLMAQAANAYQYGIVGLMAAWYDDWSWWGIAASKAFDADYEDIFGDQLEFFQTAAIDLWGLVDAGDFATVANRIPRDVWAKSAVMHGGKKFTREVLSDRAQLHTGTRNAWDLILRGHHGTGTARQNADYAYFTTQEPGCWAVPRFPDGCWQYDLSTMAFAPDDGPDWTNPNPADNTLGVFQVTLMSGLYVSFACSLVAAANRKAKERKSGPAWDRLKGGDDYQRPAGSVVGFLSSWFAVHGDDSLVQAFPSGALVHERTPTYARLDDGSYPPVQGYFSDAYWSGDQGLIMGALKQYDGVGTRSPEMLDQATASDGAAAGAADADMTGYPMKLLIGVFYNIRANDLPNAVGPYLDPSGSSPLTSDDNDYGSGSGIFWRYVLRCCRLDPSFKAEAAADATVASIAQSSGTHPNDWGNELFQPFNTVAAAIGAWYLLK